MKLLVILVFVIILKLNQELFEAQDEIIKLQVDLQLLNDKTKNYCENKKKLENLLLIIIYHHVRKIY